jgi:hypothetical protein
MSEVKIIYNGYETIIHYQLNEKLKDIFKRFKTKINAEDNELFYLYNGQKIEDKNLIISDLSSDKKIAILAYDSNDIPKLINSDYIICPICKESAILEEKDYKLNIYGCENEHITENILINKFNKFQEIDYSKIICQKCEKKRSETFNNQFYYCCECKINICPLCKPKHNNHEIMNYDDKWFKCNIYNKDNNSFCNKCKKNLCVMCENNHKKNHNENDLIYYAKVIIDNKKINNYLKEKRKEIDIFNKDIKE